MVFSVFNCKDHATQNVFVCYVKVLSLYRYSGLYHYHKILMTFSLAIHSVVLAAAWGANRPWNFNHFYRYRQISSFLLLVVNNYLGGISTSFIHPIPVARPFQLLRKFPVSSERFGKAMKNRWSRSALGPCDSGIRPDKPLFMISSWKSDTAMPCRMVLYISVCILR